MTCEGSGEVVSQGRALFLKVKSNLRNDLGETIKQQRSALGISQEELAKRSGLHRTYVSDIERGTRNPTVGTLQKIAGALQVPVAKLFQHAA